ncbi:patatin-like phospholipase family protein [Vibrio rotiferianus]|uniref:patatin-like phospholipase family protein n=1 Tax=Vibrio rotiferianus TaxID=190895 RepID=UPI00406A856E
MKAIVVEGGAMRGVFASGVIDAFLEKDYNPFDFAIGASAGVSNLVSYLSEQSGRNIDIICNLATSNCFFSPFRFLKGGDLIDVKWLVENSEQYCPINSLNLFSNIPLIAVVSCVKSGKANYIKINSDNLYKVIEATSALPMLYRKSPILSNKVYVDGGIVDSIPIYEACRMGARDITVILSHPMGYIKNKVRMKWLMRFLFSNSPKVLDAIFNRHENYNKSLSFIKSPPKDVKVHVIYPPSNFRVRRFTRSIKYLMEGYNMGLESGISYLKKRGY